MFGKLPSIQDMEKVMYKGPSSHLTWSELACRDPNKTTYPLIWRITRALELAEVFELIRSECGHKPITIISAYRTESWNRKIGGARFSQHVQGRALDLRPPKGMGINLFYDVIKNLSLISRIKGIGKYKTFVHVDTRPSDKLITWRGTGVKDDTGNKI